MDVTLTPEQQEICTEARRFLARRCAIGHVRAVAAGDRGDRSLWREIAELGWLGLMVPEAHDGLGQSFVELCLLIEEQGRHLMPGPFVSTAAIGAPAIQRFASKDQQAEHLPAIAAGDRIVAVSHERTGVTAERDRSGYVLAGAAPLIDHAASADVIVAIARLGDDLSAFLVPGDAAGLTTERLDTADGTPSFRVGFDGVRLGEDAVLGRPGRGARVAGALATWGAVARCAELVGIGQRVLEMTVEYATDRVAFGKPIGTFQAVQHHCADMAVDVLSSRSILREAAWHVAVDDPTAQHSASIAKAWVSDAIRRVCDLGHQVHGAIGFTAEHDLHLFSRRTRAAELDFGDSAWHRGLLAADLGL